MLFPAGRHRAPQRRQFPANREFSLAGAGFYRFYLFGTKTCGIFPGPGTEKRAEPNSELPRPNWEVPQPSRELKRRMLASRRVSTGAQYAMRLWHFLQHSRQRHRPCHGSGSWAVGINSRQEWTASERRASAQPCRREPSLIPLTAPQRIMRVSGTTVRRRDSRPLG
jgi:hypothetical protein